MIEPESACRILLTICVVVPGIFVICSIIRSILRSRIADHVIAVDMMGIMTIIITTILFIYLDENYLVDVSLIYAMTSFSAIIVPRKVHIGVYRERKEQQEEEED